MERGQHEYVVYRFNAWLARQGSCEACGWIVQGTHPTRLAADEHVACLTRMAEMEAWDYGLPPRFKVTRELEQV